MEVKIIEQTDDTPGVVLDKDKNEFRFNGKSLPEDVNAFYNPILEWIMEYSKNPNPETLVEFRMEYFKKLFQVMTFNKERIAPNALVDFSRAAAIVVNPSKANFTSLTESVITCNASLYSF